MNDSLVDNSPVLDQDKMRRLTSAAAVRAQTFELGLVLGGSVSTGAYTAGALDLLVQALDDFQSRYKDRPPHQVIVRLAAGSSGGAVCAAILGMSVNRVFTHVGASQADLDAGAGPGNNMFWDLWINRLTFLPMLDTADLTAAIQDPTPSIPPHAPAPPVQHVPALLNAKPIDDAVTAVVAYAEKGGDTTRMWAASPFRVATTVCNLRGVPYRFEGAPPIGDFTGAALTEHDDYAWFAFRMSRARATEPSRSAGPMNSGYLARQWRGFQSLTRQWASTPAPAAQCRSACRRAGWSGRRNIICTGPMPASATTAPRGLHGRRRIGPNCPRCELASPIASPGSMAARSTTIRSRSRMRRSAASEGKTRGRLVKPIGRY